MIKKINAGEKNVLENQQAMTSIGQQEIASSNGDLAMHDSMGDVGNESITGEQRQTQM